jgi:uncharacterized protein (TIGR00255 family)
MTAFGRGQFSAETEDFLVELHSVNSRRLEIIVNMPGDLTEFDPALRKLISGSLTRGRVSVFVSAQPTYNRGRALHVNTELAQQLKDAYDELRASLGYEGEVDFPLIASRPEIIVPAAGTADSQERWLAIQSATEQALAQLIAMKENEGSNLRPSLETHLTTLETTVGDIETLAPSSLEKRTDKLRARITEAFSELSDTQDRILREIALLADRLDICEEIARLTSHLQQFRELLDDTAPSGRTLLFLLQEMNREINTIGAKANDLAISQCVVRGKAEIEKLREQTENLE